MVNRVNLFLIKVQTAVFLLGSDTKGPRSLLLLGQATMLLKQGKETCIVPAGQPGVQTDPYSVP